MKQFNIRFRSDKNTYIYSLKKQQHLIYEILKLNLFIKYFFSILLLFINSIIIAQNYNITYSSYNKKNIVIRVKENKIEIRQLVQNNGMLMFNTSLIECDCFIKNDILYIDNGKCFKFKIVTDGILESLFDFFINKVNYISKGDLYYAKIYHNFNSGVLVGGEWQNNQKQGTWFFHDSVGKVSKIIFDHGKISNTSEMKLIILDD